MQESFAHLSELFLTCYNQFAFPINFMLSYCKEDQFTTFRYSQRTHMPHSATLLH